MLWHLHQRPVLVERAHHLGERVERDRLEQVAGDVEQGIALGVDRLVMLATGAATIDEVLTFAAGEL